ncbi:MAG: type II 3-dehydroquinate dehydratase [Porticoccaceae bacterium]|nr:type II 3-dehydroquinate dehydratase [Porticoccaceae bacterium]MDG1474767.1 type II 3-dehydroquinate dehydratase [Porticoccaceae bacterium]
MAKLLLLHGPNLNLLGTREPQVYGSETLTNIDQQMITLAKSHGHQLSTYQSNAEHELIQTIHSALADDVRLIIFNPGAFTHTSIALRDALLGVNIPFIEVHLSNVHAREEFRQFSYFSDIAEGVIGGFGVTSYELALHAALNILK